MMNKTEYFSNLLSLLEASQENQEEENLELENNGDINEEPQQIDEEAENSEEELDDANYLDDTQENPQQNFEPANQSITDIKKRKELFELFEKLLAYSELFLDSLDNLSIDLIDDEKNNRIQDKRKENDALNKKIREYLKIDFSINSYEKSLYIYILLRTELLSVITEIRKILELEKQ